MTGRDRPGRLAPAVRRWLALALMYGAVTAARGLGLLQGPVAWYLGDVLCLPLVLGLVLAGQRRTGRGPGWTLPWWHGLFAALAYGVYFEVLLPQWRSGPVGDPFDALGYLVGWLLFEGLLNRGPSARRLTRPYCEGP